MSADLREYLKSEKLLAAHPGWIPEQRDTLRLTSSASRLDMFNYLWASAIIPTAPAIFSSASPDRWKVLGSFVGMVANK